MPICPVCRSQNMETAKFCGNCGNPFTRAAESTSSLLKCEQGHIYSAVYQACPYCPGSEGLNSASFETRIEEPPELSPAQTAGEFATRIEAPAFPSGDLSTRIETPIPPEFATRIESPLARTDDLSGRAKGTTQERPRAGAAPMPSTELLGETTPSAQFVTKIEDKTSKPPAPPQPPPPQVTTKETPPPAVSAPQVVPLPPATASNVPPGSASAESGRHTSVMMAEEVKRAISSKGKLVGWLVNYGRNPDGEDYKLRAGYNRLGANPACDVVVEDETVSGSHADHGLSRWTLLD